MGKPQRPHSGPSSKSRQAKWRAGMPRLQLESYPRWQDPMYDGYVVPELHRQYFEPAIRKFSTYCRLLNIAKMDLNVFDNIVSRGNVPPGLQVTAKNLLTDDAKEAHQMLIRLRIQDKRAVLHQKTVDLQHELNMALHQSVYVEAISLAGQLVGNTRPESPPDDTQSSQTATDNGSYFYSPPDRFSPNEPVLRPLPPTAYTTVVRNCWKEVRKVAETIERMTSQHWISLQQEAINKLNDSERRQVDRDVDMATAQSDSSEKARTDRRLARIEQQLAHLNFRANDPPKPRTPASNARRRPPPPPPSRPNRSTRAQGSQGPQRRNPRRRALLKTRIANRKQKHAGPRNNRGPGAHGGPAGSAANNGRGGRNQRPLRY